VYVSINQIHPSLTFAVKAGAYPRGAPLRVLGKTRLKALPANSLLGLMQLENGLAYYG
jgi:hypothetical protein